MITACIEALMLYYNILMKYILLRISDHFLEVLVSLRMIFIILIGKGRELLIDHLKLNFHIHICVITYLMCQ